LVFPSLSLLEDKDEVFPDRAHPNAAGAGMLALEVKKAPGVWK
jgi:hypothetical protein